MIFPPSNNGFRELPPGSFPNTITVPQIKGSSSLEGECSNGRSLFSGPCMIHCQPPSTTNCRKVQRATASPFCASVVVTTNPPMSSFHLHGQSRTPFLSSCSDLEPSSKALPHSFPPAVCSSSSSLLHHTFYPAAFSL